MSNFVTDLTSLPFPKSDFRPLSLTADPTKNITAAEWNTACQALLDLRSFLLGAQVNTNLIWLLGDSNWGGQGVLATGASRENQVLVPNPNCVYDCVYSTASSEPLTIVDIGRGLLRAQNATAIPGYGPELSFGREFFTLLNGFGATPTAFNTPWIVKTAIAGVEVAQLLTTYGTSSPALGGLSWYQFARNRVLSAQVAGNRKLGLVLGYLGANDGSDGTLKTQVAAHWATLAAQIRTDFGSQVQFVLMTVNSATSGAFDPTTVRAQLAIAATAISGCRTIDPSYLPLLSDNIHFGADQIWTIGGQLAGAAGDQLGLPRRTSSVVAVRGYGPAAFNATTLTPPAFPLTQDGDLVLAVVGSMKNSGGYVTIPTPTVPASGWTQLGNSNQAMGGTQHQGFALFSRPVVQADLDANVHVPPGATIALANDENYIQLISLFGPTRNLVLDGSVTSFAFTSFSSSFVAGGVTAVAGSLVVIVMVTQGGGSGAAEAFTASNVNLTGLTLLKDSPYVMSTSNFGILTVWYGYAVGGATGNTTIATASVGLGPSCGFTAAFKAV